MINTNAIKDSALYTVTDKKTGETWEHQSGVMVRNFEYTCGHYRDLEAVEETPTEGDEIAPDHITLAGVEMAAEWSVSVTGRSVFAFYELDGERFRVTFTGECREYFKAAMDAAKNNRTTVVDGEGLSLILGEAVHLEKRAKPTSADPSKQRHGEVPEKWFIGLTMEGRSWKILFDGDTGKTRVIFPRKPSAKVLETVKAAGFFWSPTMKSWNKGLNFRAFRAAEKLHATLNAMAAA